MRWGLATIAVVAGLIVWFVILPSDSPLDDEGGGAVTGGPVGSDVVDGPLVPDTGMLLGLWSKPPSGDWTRSSVRERFEHLEHLADRRMDIAHSFHPWEEEFPGWREIWAIEGGRTPLVSWDGTETSEIAAGQHDDTIRARADAVGRLGVPVFIRFMWEMDIARKQDRVGTPEDYVAAWRHVREVFHSRGATNAVWVWCPTAESFDEGRAAAYYPGDDQVDWVCALGYNWAGTTDGARWRSPAEIFGTADRFARDRGLPLMVGETGAVETEPGEKARWLMRWAEDLEDGLLAVRAVVYFDSDRRHPWWLDSSDESAEAWRMLATHPVVTGAN